MAEFKLGRIKFVWKGGWVTATTYYVDDIVRVGGRTYVCTLGHTSAADFNTDLEASPTKWNLFSSGNNWRGDWTTSTLYQLGDLVKYGGNVYNCNDSHTSAATATLGLETDSAKWDTFIEGLDWQGAWTTSTRYKINDLVRYGGITYVCNTGHTSSATASSGLEANQASWTAFNEGIEYKGTWSAGSVRYKVNDVVKYGGGLWICIAQHTSSAAFSEASFSQFVEGTEYEAAWSSGTTYQPGDIVSYGGNQYIAKQIHSAQTPSTATTFWDLYSEGFDFQGDWSSVYGYRIGQVVRQNGYTYLATADSLSTAYTVTASNTTTDIFTTSNTAGMVAGMTVRFAGVPFGGIIVSSRYYIQEVTSGSTFKISETPGGAVFNLTTASGTMTATVAAEPPNSSYWTLLSSGIFWRGDWQDDREYNAGDAVKFGVNSYICILAHRSEGDDGSSIGVQGGGAANSRPDQDVTGTYWNALTLGSETSPLTVTGDLVYYGGAGPTRLPIGTKGQVLKVSSSGIPEWSSFWGTDHVYYVKTDGTDVPYPEGGRTLDTAWKTIRYACEQIEKGPRNPNAQKLLELNRVFIQREVSEWIQYQVANNIAPFTTSFDFDEYKCERDVGFIIDALIYDLGHGGNVKTRGAANSYVGGLSPGEIEPYGVGLGNEDTESVAALNYMLNVVEDVLDQTSPAVNYQTTNGDNSTAIVSQYFDADIVAETGTYDTVESLVEIVTDAITAGDADDIPERVSPSNLIKVSTGTYKEVLPIIVPEQTCVLGDELRSTNVQPAAVSDRSLDVSDAKYSLGALSRMETIVAEIVQGSNVTESAGNTETQSASWPFADSTTANDAKRLVRTIQQNIDFRLNSNILASYTLPTGYNSSYLSGYGDARTLIRENRDFAKEELIAFIAVNYPTVKYSKTKCRRDVGYIIDALIYDLTYGGNSQSVNAALAYFDGPGSEFAGIFGESSSEVAATIASYERLKTILQQIAANTTVTKSTGNEAVQWTDSTNLSGGSSASTFIGNNIDIIIDILTAGSTTGAPSVTVTSITGSNTAVTSVAHGLNVGDTFVPRTTANGFTSGVKYWVLTIPSGTEFRVSTTFGGTQHTLTNGTGLTIVGDVVDTPPATNGVTSTTALISAAQALDAVQETIVTNTTAFIAANYPSLTYNSAKCERDVRLILEAVMFDFMFNSNVQTLRAGYSYLRSTASDVYTLGQKAATRAAFAYAKDQAKSNVGGNATAQARIETLMTTLDDVVFSGSLEGSRCATDSRMSDYAILQLERNRDYIVAEIDAYIDATYTTTVTNATASTDVFTCASTAWMQRNTAVRFSGTVFGGVSTGVTYYVQNVVSATTFKIAAARNSNTPIDITGNASGSMTVSLYYNSDLCLRDVGTYIDALKYDLRYVGNYKSLYAARYYANAAIGSLEEDMYYLRDATGIRDQTLTGLTGDLLAENEYGTSRVSAGAYCSLDPGWGPEDYRTWIMTRSPYVQGVTTFGTAAVGQKIDGALHNGGNDSIVSNDFTQVISDGIGAWVLNNGRAELVSVFTYYAHIGYLAESGGRIRATNGNNSYGDFGAVAEGVDSSETPDTAVIDNQSRFAATANVISDGAQVLGLEFTHAGNDYTDASGAFSGGGVQADAEFDEFRDDGVFQVRLTGTGDDSSGQFGGEGYVTAANTAQTGTTSSITLAATDSRSSAAYIGMKIYLDGGTGRGQFGIINSYNSGTKIAGIIRESDGGSGWDHVVPGTTIVSPNASTTYTIEPRLSFISPGFSSSRATISASATWTSAVYGDTAATYTGLSGTYSGSGASGATWTIIRNGSSYVVTKVGSGTGYERLETITISGTSLGGLTPDNDVEITILAVNSTTGAITEFEYDGRGCGGVYVAIASGGTAASYSTNGTSWSNATLPSSGTWTSVAHGTVQDGSTVEDISMFVAVRSGSSAAAYSTNGITWTASVLPTSANWNSVTFGDGRFVAIATNSTTVAISQDGINWDITGTLPGTGFNAVTYGMGLYVAVASGTTNAASSTDGVTWTARNLPTGSTWNSVTWGNGRFVAVPSDSNSGAYSINGTTWTVMTIGSADGSTVGGYQQVRYGQGLFMATAYLASAEDYSFVATSENGINWTVQGVDANPNGMSGYNALTFGNPHSDGYWVVIERDSGNDIARIRTGATARARCSVADEKIFEIRIVEPGSGYDTVPTMTITDPNNLYEAPFTVRIGKGALATPSFITRGTGYTAGDVTISGNGYADLYQNGGIVAVKWLTSEPRAGSNVVFGHLPDRVFKLVSVTGLLGSVDGARKAFFQVSPVLEVFEVADHEEGITTRLRYSQVRMTGHDFLDIGTGNFIETNYPGLPTQDPIPANETVENGGGRVFYTATDQDGNFRVGGLFSVEQATGVATLNADAFNISGLQELQLGEVTLGGGSATITEFSTDPFFTADSDSVIPTQRAIKSYIASQIGGGGASLNVNSVTAGAIVISGSTITTSGSETITMNASFNFRKGVIGLPLAFSYFLY